MTLAIFDIDGTLVRGSTERRFWRYLFARGRQGPRQILAGAWFLVRFLPRFGVRIAKKNKAYLVGLETTDVAALAADFVVHEILPRLYEPAVQRLHQHLRAGDTVALLSGTLEPIALALAEHLGVRHVRATVCAERDGRYLAQPPVLASVRRAKSGIGGGARRAARHGFAACRRVRRFGTRPETARSGRLARRRAAGWEVAARSARKRVGRDPSGRGRPDDTQATRSRARLHVGQLAIRDEVERNAAISAL